MTFLYNALKKYRHLLHQFVNLIYEWNLSKKQLHSIKDPPYNLLHINTVNKLTAYLLKPVVQFSVSELC